MAKPPDQPEPSRRILWDRLCRFQLSRRRRSRRRLAEFCAQHASDEPALVVHCVDVDHHRYFPNAFVICARDHLPADLHTDRYYGGLSQVADGSYGLIVCTGLLEHVPDPAALIGEFRRILKPGGRLIVSASGVFPFHGGPHNFFHFTLDGFRYLFRAWSGFEMLRGSTRPFETISILLQRVNMHCDIFPPVRLLVEALQHTLPLLDRFVYREYANHARRDRGDPPGSVMPVTVHAVVIR